MDRYPPEVFKLEPYDEWDVIKGWKWILSFISEKDWENRKAAIENKLSLEFTHHDLLSKCLSEGKLLVEKKDVIGWYLYLVDTAINQRYKYEFYQAARIIPIFKRIGQDLDLIKRIKGIEQRIKELVKKRRAEADALLFEILAAALWVRNGYEVEFIEESSEGKTPDFLAHKDKKTWQIECKRQSKTSDYTNRENTKRQKMISFLSEMLVKKNILLNITFHVELEKLPDTYLFDLLKDKLDLIIPGKIIANEEVDIDLSLIDMAAINNHLDNYLVKYYSPTNLKLIGGDNVNQNAFTCGMEAKYYRIGEGEVNNLFVYEIKSAFGVSWYCDAKDALIAKARDIKSQVASAIEQINFEYPGVIHIGLETFDGAEVEKERYEKIAGTLKMIDPTKSNLRWIFCHFFQSYALPEQDWVFDETVSSMSGYEIPRPPLSITHLIIPEDIDIIDNMSHWERPL